LKTISQNARSEHIQKLVECGIAFQGKKVMVKGRILTKQQGQWVVQDGIK